MLLSVFGSAVPRTGRQQQRSQRPKPQRVYPVTRVYSEYARFSIELQKPLGLILGTTADLGAVVEDIVPGGNADKLGNVQVGDMISKVTTIDGIVDCENMDFDVIISLLAEASSTVELELKRGSSSEQDEENNIAAYWERKRLEKEKGKRVLRRTLGVEPDDIRIVKTLSQGNFGSVFTARWKDSPVILKTSKANVLWADDLLDVELEMNEIVHRRAKGSCARFLGCCEIDPRSEGEIYNGRLSAGLWLMWRNDGLQTLGEIFKYENEHLMRTLRENIGIDESALAIVTIKAFIRHISSCLSSLHAVGVVHRDVKPENILLGTEGIVLIDLGASASCLSEIVNYYRGPGPADPLYCAPDENYLLPLSAPEPNLQNAAELWDKFKPDRFDAFSLGIIFLQLCVAQLRDKVILERFIQELSICSLDLKVWKASLNKFSSQETALLDSDNGAGWDFASTLVCARELRVSLSQVQSHSFIMTNGT